MATNETLQERVAALENEVSRLRWELAHSKGRVSGRTAPDFLEQFAGIFANDPAFEEFTQYMEERAQTERAEAERLAEAD